MSVIVVQIKRMKRKLLTSSRVGLSMVVPVSFSLSFEKRIGYQPLRGSTTKNIWASWLYCTWELLNVIFEHPRSEKGRNLVFCELRNARKLGIPELNGEGELVEGLRVEWSEHPGIS